MNLLNHNHKDCKQGGTRMKNYSISSISFCRRTLLWQSAGLGAGVALSGLLPSASAWAAPVTQLGPEVALGQVNEGVGKASIPPNSLLTSLQLGKTARTGPRWLNVGYSPIQGAFQLALGDENVLPVAIPPPSNGGGPNIHAPEGTIVSALLLGPSALTVFYRKVNSPASFKLGPEALGVGTKEPHDNGGGGTARQNGDTITGFQMQKDPDGTLSLRIWYRPVL